MYQVYNIFIIMFHYYNINLTDLYNYINYFNTTILKMCAINHHYHK